MYYARNIFNSLPSNVSWEPIEPKLFAYDGLEWLKAVFLESHAPKANQQIKKRR